MDALGVPVPKSSSTRPSKETIVARRTTSTGWSALIGTSGGGLDGGDQLLQGDISSSLGLIGS